VIIVKEQLDKYVADGLIKCIPDPFGSPLALYNYTFEATTGGTWPDLVRASRGLVVGTDGTVYGRPFRKFFNLDEHAETKRSVLPQDEVPQLAEKLDGSLIIVFWDPFMGKWRAVTRGSWISDQANWVNDASFGLQNFMRENYLAPNNYVSKQATYLFELIANWNRIVVCYTTPGKLVCLGKVNNHNGHELDYYATQDFCRLVGWEAVKFVEKPIDEVDLDAKFKNDEGYVARFSNGLRVKLKYKEYLHIHRVVTGLSVRGIWEMLRDGTVLDKNSLPDEFLKYFDLHANRLSSEYEKIELRALRAFVKVDPTLTRKEKALIWKEEPHVVQSVCFALLNKYPYSEIIWKTLKPEADTKFKQEEETQ
jgi:RNA ligase